MKNFQTSIQLTVILLMIHSGLSAQSGAGTHTVQGNGNIKVAGEKSFSSPNPKTSKDATEPLLLNYSQVFKGFFKLEPGTHGITGTIDKPGGKITLEVFAYTPEESDGIQKITLSYGTKVPRIVYSCYIDKSTEVGRTPRRFQAQTTMVDYGYLRDRDQPDKITAYGRATSTDLKTLGAGCKNGFLTSTCVNSLWAGVHWIASGLNANLWLAPEKQMTVYQCADVAENYYGGTQPVIIRLTVKDATLEDYAIPAMTTRGIKTLGLQTKTVKVIKKVKITILEPGTMNQTVDFYKTKLISTIRAANRYFTDRTGRVKPKEVTAEVGNFGTVLRDVDVVIKKAKKANYNYEDQIQAEALIREFGYVSGSSLKTINIIYVATLDEKGKAMGSATLVKRGLIGVADTSFVLHDIGDAFSPSNKHISIHGPHTVFFTHELGHYFGLLHPFEGGCKGGDNINDTPPCEGGFWHMKNGTLLNNACANAPIQCGQRRQVENLMDYGPCCWLFTQGQVDHMNRVIAAAPDLYESMVVAVGNELPALNINVSDLRNAASGKVNFTSETVADHQGPIQEEELLETPSPDFTLYPNPTEGPLHLDYTMPCAGTGQLSIRDLMGEIVYEEKLSFVAGRNHYAIEHLKLQPTTYYILRFKSEAMTRIVRLISK